MFGNYENKNFISFVGLSAKDAAKLYSYMHFGHAILLSFKSIIERASLDKSIDFMDSIEDDIPKGKAETHFFFFNSR